jgi:hypothetical protein
MSEINKKPGKKRKFDNGLMQPVSLSVSPDVKQLLEQEAETDGSKSAAAEKIFRVYFKLPEIQKAS